MNNNNRINTSTQRQSQSSTGCFKEPYFTLLIYRVFHMTMMLAVTRLLTVEIFQMISDLLSALIVYFFISPYTRGKCTSIILIINGLIGFVNAVQRTIIVYAYFELEGGFFLSLLLVIAFYGIIVYSLISLIGILGCGRTQWEFGGVGIMGSNQVGDGQVSGGHIVNNQINDEERRGFVAFQGRGTAVGN